MGNQFFQFKQFKIEQDQCAMKVCTDSCIFGAWIEAPTAKTILDVGTGTGLLSLMLAQKHEAKIDAVEIDEKAYQQAKQNITASPWKDKIKIILGRIQEYSASPYDVIISNPPFFSNHLKSKDSARNSVLHSTTLTLEELISSVDRLLSVWGRFYVLLPPEESKQMDHLAYTRGLFPFKKLVIKERMGKPVLRIISTYHRKSTETEIQELTIRNTDLSYSSDFRKLLEDYYLHL